ncbi:MAG TPA: ABC transporter permease subunit [Ktedonosporobacter sp.]|nr:ABC transporter permease subunit [Ktedonosporobacter sp.]
MSSRPIEKMESAIEQGPANAPAQRTRSRGIWGSALFYVVIGFFVLNLFGMVIAVLLNSLGQQWFATWLPEGLFTNRWYEYEFGINDIVQLGQNTLIIAITTTVLALLIAFPAAYVLARRQFRFKGLLTGLYLLPMLVPPMAYAIPLATLVLRYLGGLPDIFPINLLPVILVNLVPILPFVILILTPFVEQVDTSLESASRMLGANGLQTFWRVVLPLVLPGLLTAGVLAVVRTVASFELTFLVARADAQTLVVTLFADDFAAGMRPQQATDAMAVVYMLTTMALLGIALIFVKPTQFVVRLKGR